MAEKMPCPSCRSPHSKVVDSRKAVNTVWRRRMCCACHKPFSTYEISDVLLRKLKANQALVTAMRKLLKRIPAPGTVSVAQGVTPDGC